MLDHKLYGLKAESIILSRTDKGEFRKPEAPEAKAKREALELFESNVLYGLDDVIEALSNAGMLKSKEEGYE